MVKENGWHWPICFIHYLPQTHTSHPSSVCPLCFTWSTISVQYSFMYYIMCTVCHYIPVLCYACSLIIMLHHPIHFCYDNTLKFNDLCPYTIVTAMHDIVLYISPFTKITISFLLTRNLCFLYLGRLVTCHTSTIRWPFNPSYAWILRNVFPYALPVYRFGVFDLLIKFINKWFEMII